MSQYLVNIFILSLINNFLPIATQFNFLILHGYFFIDAGRQYIDGWQQLDEKISNTAWESDTYLKRAWNSELARTQVFPLVLPAFSDFSMGNSLKVSDITIVTKAFSNSDLWSKFRHFLTTKHCWILTMSSDGISWALQGSNQSFLKIFKDRDVQIEDDLIEKRDLWMNKNVQSCPKSLVEKCCLLWRNHPQGRNRG